MKYTLMTTLISISLLACQDDSLNQSSRLLDEWYLIGYADEQGQLIEPEPDSQTDPLTIRFTVDSIRGDLDVNDFYGRYRPLDKANIDVNNLTYTEMVGTPRENAFLRNFPHDIARYTIRADTLVLFPANNTAFEDQQRPTVYRRADSQ